MPPAEGMDEHRDYTHLVVSGFVLAILAAILGLREDNGNIVRAAAIVGGMAAMRLPSVLRLERTFKLLIIVIATATVASGVMGEVSVGSLLVLPIMVLMLLGGVSMITFAIIGALMLLRRGGK